MMHAAKVLTKTLDKLSLILSSPAQVHSDVLCMYGSVEV